jgi:hypothetical protein
MEFKVGGVATPDQKWSKELIRRIGLEPGKNYNIVSVLKGRHGIYSYTQVSLVNERGKHTLYDSLWLKPVEQSRSEADT